MMEDARRQGVGGLNDMVIEMPLQSTGSYEVYVENSNISLCLEIYS